MAFRDDRLRDEFLNHWPQYEIDRQIEKLENERNKLAAGLRPSKIGTEGRLAR
jgi:hypothetical protein